MPWEDRRRLAMELVRAALAAVDPARAVAGHLDRQGRSLRVGGRAYRLTKPGRVFVVGAGKAGGGMAAAVEERLGEHLSAGWVNVRQGYEPSQPLRRVHVHPAAHPLPDEPGVEGTRRILEMTADLDERDLVLVLLSGGASALLELPVEGVSLEDLQQLTAALLRSGADIAAINTVRKHLSQVKGGQLARGLAPAQVAVLVFSDVVGNPLEAIGSGPCAPDPTTFDDAWQVLSDYHLLENLPAAVRARLERGRAGQIAETPKPGEPLFERVAHIVVGDNRQAALAAVEQARALGLQAMLLTTYLEGEAREAGRFLAALAKEEARYDRPLPRPACLVLGGETTVTVRGEGRGGRNQEVALGAAVALAGWPDVMVVTLATDGTDGPTDAAGAIVTGETVARARALGLDPLDHLARNDSYTLFAALGDLVSTGPTGTNVNDLSFVLTFPPCPQND